MKRTVVVFTALLVWNVAAPRGDTPYLQFVFSSDAHYGITRPHFRGADNVDARIVNRALVARVNQLPAATFPKDGGLRAGEPIGAVDFFAETGDVANREEDSEGQRIQSASASWAQFKADYLDGITLKDQRGGRTPVFVVPGNHEASNAVGFYRPMTPARDVTPIVEIYNRMMAPAKRLTNTTFDYARDKVAFSRDVSGLHFVFVSVWPDSGMRRWIESDLQKLRVTTPVMLFTHDQPDAEAKHFINPNGAHDINAADQFENLLADTFADGRSVEGTATSEHRALERFLTSHPSITAYFHGNSNWNQFYDWTGPDHTAALHTFRADSPMKGAVSAADETKLSFQVVTIDTVSRTMTVRECLWNADPAHPTAPIVWGGSTTVALFPRPKS